MTEEQLKKGKALLDQVSTLRSKLAAWESASRITTVSVHTDGKAITIGGESIDNSVILPLIREQVRNELIELEKQFEAL